MNDLVSIIIPIYNSEKYITKCLNSVINQTYKNIELLLIDDGSTDYSYEKCKKFKKNDNRIKLYKKSNGGVAKARNFGIEKANGKYITFVDSDDYIERDMIKNMVQELENADMVLCNTNEIKNGVSNINNWFPQTQLLTDAKDIEYYCASTITNNITNLNIKKFIGPGYATSKIVLTSIIRDNDIRFNEDIYYLEDNLFWFEVSRKCKKIKLINKPYYNYVIHENSLTTKIKPKLLDNNKAIYNSFIINNLSLIEKEALNVLLIRCLIDLIKYTFLPSKKSTNKSLKGTILENSEYKTAISEVKIKYLTNNQKLLIFLIKTKLYLIFPFDYCYKKLQKKGNIKLKRLN